MDRPTLKVLIAEDNAALRRVLAFTFEKVGHQVVAAANGRLAFEEAQHQDFDLVLTDQTMPEMSGVELCQNLRTLPGYANTPLILLTAKGLELELPKLCAELGLAATFAKPFSPMLVLRTAEGLLQPTA